MNNLTETDDNPMNDNNEEFVNTQHETNIDENPRERAFGRMARLQIMYENSTGIKGIFVKYWVFLQILRMKFFMNVLNSIPFLCVFLILYTSKLVFFVEYIKNLIEDHSPQNWKIFQNIKFLSLLFLIIIDCVIVVIIIKLIHNRYKHLSKRFLIKLAKSLFFVKVVFIIFITFLHFINIDSIVDGLNLQFDNN